MSFVPYTGAIADVDLNTNNLYANAIGINLVGDPIGAQLDVKGPVHFHNALTLDGTLNVNLGFNIGGDGVVGGNFSAAGDTIILGNNTLGATPHVDIIAPGGTDGLRLYSLYSDYGVNPPSLGFYRSIGTPPLSASPRFKIKGTSPDDLDTVGFSFSSPEYDPTFNWIAGAIDSRSVGIQAPGSAPGLTPAMNFFQYSYFTGGLVVVGLDTGGESLPNGGMIRSGRKNFPTGEDNVDGADFTIAAGGGTGGSTVGGNIYFQTPDVAAALQVQPLSTKMILARNGDVGIGTVPTTKLTVFGTDAAPANSGTTATAISRITAASGVSLEMGINGAASPVYSWLQCDDRTDQSLHYNFVINPNGGYVGIGTTSPSTQLEVSNGGAAANATIRIDQTNSAGYMANLSLNNASTGGHQWDIISSGNGDSSLGTGNFAIRDVTFSASVPRLLINTSGFVGIGYIADPTSGNKFAVDGNSYFNGSGAFTGALTANGATQAFGSIFAAAQTYSASSGSAVVTNFAGTQNAATTGTLEVIDTTAYVTHTSGTVQVARSHHSIVNKSGAGTLNQGEGYNAVFVSSDGATTNFIGYRVSAPNLSGGATIGNGYGVYVNAWPSGVGNKYSFYAEVGAGDLVINDNGYIEGNFGVNGSFILGGGMNFGTPLPVYANNTAAITGGLYTGDVYRTSAGVLMIVYVP